jgi:glycosyltransferase involved in cell wall biosynthesis
MIRFIRGGHFDIVHTHSSKAGILGRLAARIAGVPVRIHTVHGWSFHERMGRLNRRFNVILERVAARITDSLIVVTETDLDKGLQAGIGTNRQYALIRSGIDFGRFNGRDSEPDRRRVELGLRPDSFLVGTMGRLSPQKSPLDFVKMAEMLSRELENVEFIYLGDGPLRGEVERMIRSRGLMESVHLLGMRDDVERIIGLLDVYVQTSLWEGLPRAFLEATAAGVPVVATRVDGAKEFFEDGLNGFIVGPRDIDTMVQNVKRLLKDPDLRARIVKNAREKMGKEYSVDVMIEGIESLYRRLMRDNVGAGSEKSISSVLTN